MTEIPKGPEGIPNRRPDHWPDPVEFARSLRDAETPEELIDLALSGLSAVLAPGREPPQLSDQQRASLLHTLGLAPPSGIISSAADIGSDERRAIYEVWNKQRPKGFVGATEVTEEEDAEMRDVSDETNPIYTLEAGLQALEGLPNIHFGQMPSPPEFARMLREANTPAEIMAINEIVDRAAATAPSATLSVFADILEERRNQDAKWGADRSLVPSLWLTILVEEVGEVAETILDELNGVFGEGGGQGPDDMTAAEVMRAELVQVAAVAVAQIEQLDREASA